MQFVFNLVIQVFTRMDSRSPSPTILSQADAVNSNMPETAMYNSDDEKLETIGRKVSAIINGNIFTDTRSSDNGNMSSETDEVLHKRRCSEPKEERESTEDAANDSFTDDEREHCNHLALRRKRYVYNALFYLVLMF